MLRKGIKSADVVVVGAGIAGCSAFFGLAKRNRNSAQRGAPSSFKPMLLDAMSPMSLTSARGSFQYRNWWPNTGDEIMMRLVSRSIDLMDEYADEIDLNRNGYLFVTRNKQQVDEFRAQAKYLETLGGGKLREHEKSLESYNPSTNAIDRLDGCDLLLGFENVVKAFPSLSASNVIAALHVRRAGSLNPFKMGNYQLTKATEYCPNAQVLRGKMIDIHATGGQISGITVAMDNGDKHFVATKHLVLSPGPMLQQTLDLLYEKNLIESKLPINHELHARVIFDDPKQIMSSTSPLTFDMDPIGNLRFPEKPQGAKNDRLAKESFPAGVHIRPYGDSKALAVWTYDTAFVDPIFPVQQILDPRYGEICLRGLLPLFPQIESYLSDPHVLASIQMDGGYYVKTPDNMPLIGNYSNGVDGLYFQAAMTGVGLMSSAASGELLAATVMNDIQYQNVSNMPPFEAYADALSPNRFCDESYLESIDGRRQTSGQM
ncbi:oxidoreductase [Thraustotheca clavata]|uniref:FAD-dependent oxidoreductase domain-containing protein 1 n=1 Tax=Thraustotheca clavata TaxID=74557 RepID=A0A1V9Y830_9STRA|nr:oxidoreductase [Thraustotheca clavata]